VQHLCDRCCVLLAAQDASATSIVSFDDRLDAAAERRI
jgi:hypothetical protein